MSDDAEFEYQTKTLVIDQQFQATCQQLQDEGWEIVPGAMPIAVYHLRRKRAGIGAEGGIAIDESKITVIRGHQRGHHHGQH